MQYLLIYKQSVSVICKMYGRINKMAVQSGDPGNIEQKIYGTFQTVLFFFKVRKSYLMGPKGKSNLNERDTILCQP